MIDKDLSATQPQNIPEGRPTFNRRHFVKAALATAGVALCASAEAGPKEVRAPRALIDVNINVSRWPFRRVAADDTATLVSMLRSHGVAQAWAGSFDGLLHKDITGVNARLSEESRRHGRGLLVPMGSINPKLPDWEEELRRCAEGFRMPGIRLHPNYHGYKLDNPDFARLLRRAGERRLVVQLTLLMEDERMMHPLGHVSPVAIEPLAAVIKDIPGLRLVLLNALGQLRDDSLKLIIQAGDVYVEISMLEGVGGVGKLLERIPLKRVLFGSHAPLFYFESAVLKLKESPLTANQLRAVGSENARRLLSA
jgi:predicted TIM-barrel fold metal-dependent hydrolase